MLSDKNKILCPLKTRISVRFHKNTQSIEADARYIIAAALVPLNVHEDTLAYPLIKSAYDI
ncbi:MAG TPA: hypothetical protein VMV86_04345, partial [Methanosarcinales archaeon]|nr:hypothetical protein [Methanosarcinales archaeon]